MLIKNEKISIKFTIYIENMGRLESTHTMQNSTQITQSVTD